MRQLPLLHQLTGLGWTTAQRGSTLVRMPSAQPHRGPVTRAEFDRFAPGHIRKPDRDTAFAWIQACEQHGHWFPSAANAVNEWVIRQMRRSS